MISQTQNNTACNVMYMIRDALNEMNIEYALYLSADLTRMLKDIVDNGSKIGCILDCDIIANG